MKFNNSVKLRIKSWKIQNSTSREIHFLYYPEKHQQYPHRAFLIGNDERQWSDFLDLLSRVIVRSFKGDVATAKNEMKLLSEHINPDLVFAGHSAEILLKAVFGENYHDHLYIEESGCPECEEDVDKNIAVA